MLIKYTTNEIGQDDGIIYKNNKLLSNGPLIEKLNANENYLEYENYVMPYSSDFIKFINTKFSNYNLSKNNENINSNNPLKYQEFIKEYMKFGTPYRGILINHGLGSGKTRSCIMVSETFRNAGLQILFLGPASLKNNYIEELYKWGDDDIKLSEKSTIHEKLRKRKIIDKSYKFISSNSSNVLVQLAKIGIGYPDLNNNLYNKGVADYINKNNIKKLNYPQNMLIIIEEAHNINQKFSSKSSKTVKKIYDFLKYAIDCKIVAISATPIINKPYEICTLLNFLKGPLIDGSSLMPETEEDFNALYLNKENKLINKGDLQTRILGLISYYKGITSDRTQYPDLVYLDTFYINMSEEQNALHDYYLEQELTKYLDKDNEIISQNLTELIKEVEAKEKLYGLPLNSYRINSRTVCNYIWKINDNDIDKPNMITLPHVFEFKNIDFKNPNNFSIFFFKENKMPTLDKLAEEINNFAFSKEFKFKYYDYIMYNTNASIFMIKDIFTCALLLTYCNVSRLPAVLNSSDKSSIKLSSKYNINPIRNYLTDNDLFLLNDIIKSRKQKIDEAIHKMSLEGEKYFSNEALQKHSPKMLAVLNNILNGIGRLEEIEEIEENEANEPYEEKIETDNYDDTIDLINDIDENNEELFNEIDMINIDDDLNANNTKQKKDKNIYLLYYDNILYPNESYKGLNEFEIFEKLKEKIEDNNFINLLLKTKDKYILYTPQLNIINNKYYIKGDNAYGRGLMYYRNYLNSFTDLYYINNHNISFITFDNVYATKKVKGGPAFVYSEFNNAEGIAIFAKILEYNGFMKLDLNEFSDPNYDITIDDYAPRYAIISGNIDMEDRSSIIRLFNSIKNKHGQFIRVLLGTSAASEGINLKYIRQVQILEPFWHNIKIEQVIGRARRLTSHLSLPMDQRYIYIHKYISKSITDIESTDEYLYKLAALKYSMIEDIYSLLKGAAIDCGLNSAVNKSDIKCFKFPENMINKPAFKLYENDNENKAEIIKKEETIKLKAIEKIDNNIKYVIGYYKVINDFDSNIPIEKKMFVIKNDPRFGSYANKKIELFPVYNEQALQGIFTIIGYGHFKANGAIQRFPLSSV